MQKHLDGYDDEDTHDDDDDRIVVLMMTMMMMVLLQCLVMTSLAKTPPPEHPERQMVKVSKNLSNLRGSCPERPSEDTDSSTSS